MGARTFNIPRLSQSGGGGRGDIISLFEWFIPAVATCRWRGGGESAPCGDNYLSPSSPHFSLSRSLNKIPGLLSTWKIHGVIALTYDIQGLVVTRGDNLCLTRYFQIVKRCPSYAWPYSWRSWLVIHRRPLFSQLVTATFHLSKHSPEVPELRPGFSKVKT